MDYDNFTNSKNLGWFDTGPCHNKNICSRLYGTTFEGFIIQARTDRYNIICSLAAHDRMQDMNKMMKAVLVIEKYQKMQQ